VDVVRDADVRGPGAGSVDCDDAAAPNWSALMVRRGSGIRIHRIGPSVHLGRGRQNEWSVGTVGCLLLLLWPPGRRAVSRDGACRFAADVVTCALCLHLTGSSSVTVVLMRC
jgi:hypothetical protein